MQTLSVGSTSLLLDDDTASAIVWYSVQLAKSHLTECVEVAGYNTEERPVTAQLVLGDSVDVTALTAYTDLPDPDNDAARQRIRADSDRLEHPPLVEPDELVVAADLPHDML